MEINTKDELLNVIKNLQEEIESTKTELSETRQIVDTYNNSNSDNQEQEGSENEDSENDFSEDELDEVSELLLEE